VNDAVGNNAPLRYPVEAGLIQPQQFHLVLALLVRHAVQESVCRDQYEEAEH
jgi:hypothetical protein